MGMKRGVLAAAAGIALAMSGIQTTAASAAAPKSAADQGEYLAYMLKGYNGVISSGEMYDIHAGFDKLNTQIKTAEKSIAKVSGSSKRKSLSAKYIKPAKVARERVIYEVSEYRLLKNIGRMTIENKITSVDSSLKKLIRLKNRAVAIKKAGKYTALPKSIGDTLSGIEGLIRSNKFSVPDPNLNYKLNDTELDVFLLINRDRQKAGLPMLTLHERLSYAAKTKAKDMYTNHYFGTRSPKYGYLNEMLPKMGITKFKAAGENIFKYYTTPQAMRDAWRKTPDQRNIVLNKQIVYVGIGTDHEYAAHHFLIP